MEAELPQGWIWFDMLDVIDYEGGSQPPKKVFKYEPSPGYVRLIQIRDYGEKPFPTYVPDSPRLKKVDESDLLIARYGGSSANDSLGRICGGIAGAYNVALAKVIFPHQVLNPTFVKYLLSGPWFKERLNSLSRSCQTGFNRDDLKELFLPLPPLAEQRRIVAKLDAVMAKVEANKRRLDKVPQLLKRFRQSVLAAAVSGKLTEEWRESNNFENTFNFSNQFEVNESYKKQFDLPTNWKWVALGNYVKCERGRFSIRPRNDPRYFGGAYPFIQIGDLPREGGFVTAHTQTLNSKGLKVSKMFPKDTIAVAIVGATIGNTGILAYDMCFTDSMVGISKGDLHLNLFLDFYLRTERENIRQLSYAGGGQPNIKLELINAYPCPVPPLEEQKEIVFRVQKLFNLVDKLEARYTNAEEILGRLPQSILAKAFRGELVAQDSKDEPVEVLLERIRNERQNRTRSKVTRNKTQKRTTTEV